MVSKGKTPIVQAHRDLIADIIHIFQMRIKTHDSPGVDRYKVILGL
jgi:hypothetical protein